MSTNNLFETTLIATKHRGLRSLSESEGASLSERNDTSEVIELLQQLAVTINPQTPLSDSMELFAAANNLSPDDLSFLEKTLIEATERALETDTIEEDDVRSFLAQLNKPFPKPTETSATVLGATPKGTQAFLNQLKVQKHPDAFGNDDVFRASDVSAFNRAAHSYGHGYEPFNDQPNKPLANARLNVSVKEAFGIVDTTGFGERVANGYRVVNKLTSEFVSKPMHHATATQIAMDLNDEFAIAVAEAQEQELAEQPVPSDIPSTPITESILVPLSSDKMNRYLAAFEQQKTNSNAVDQPSTIVSDWKVAALLQEKQRAKCAPEPSEHDALKQKSNSQRRLTSSEPLVMLGTSETDGEFLASINSRRKQHQ
jgi:hypothetical protein